MITNLYQQAWVEAKIEVTKYVQWHFAVLIILKPENKADTLAKHPTSE